MLEKRSENTCHLVPKWNLKRAPETSKSVYFSIYFCLLFSTCFCRRFGVEMHRKWVQKGVQNVTKNHEKSTPAPECDFGAIWGRFLTDFGQIWGRILIDFRLILDRFWVDFDMICCTHFSASKTTENEKLAKAHEPVAAKKHPAFEKMRFPSHQLADQVAHAIGCNSASFFR